MGELKLHVEAFAGAPIADVCSELVALANRMQITVMCDFNGVKLMAVPGDDAAELCADWDRKLRSNHGYKLARGRPSNTPKEPDHG